MFTRARTLMLATVALLGLLVIVGTVWIRFAPGILRSLSAVQGPPAVGMSNSPLPLPSSAPPTEEIIVITPGPDGVVNLPPATPGQVYAFASPTPFPTPTPRSTPTRRPGPTAIPLPFKVPAPDASGMIVYVQDGSKGIMYVSVGPNAEKLTEVETLQVSLDINVYELASSPDGRNLLLMDSSFPGGFPFLLNMQSGGMYPLIDESTTISGRFFGWHPDSQQILFWPTIDELWLINAFSNEKTVLSLLNGSVQGASISPDGQQVAYVTFADTPSQTAQYGVWIVSTAGSDAVLTLVGPAYLFGWSPDGKYLLYMGEPSTQQDIKKPSIKQDENITGMNQGPLWISESDGKNARALSVPYLNGFGYEPVWSPDGKWVASVGLQEGEKPGCGDAAKWPECQFEGTGIYVENVETGEMRFLTPGLEPVWSPDGNYLAFLSLEDGSIGVQTVSLIGEKTQQLVVNARSVKGFIWMSNEEVKP